MFLRGSVLVMKDHMSLSLLDFSAVSGPNVSAYWARRPLDIDLSSLSKRRKFPPKRVCAENSRRFPQQIKKETKIIDVDNGPRKTSLMNTRAR